MISLFNSRCALYSYLFDCPRLSSLAWFFDILSPGLHKCWQSIRWSSALRKVCLGKGMYILLSSMKLCAYFYIYNKMLEFCSMHFKQFCMYCTEKETRCEWAKAEQGRGGATRKTKTGWNKTRIREGQEEKIREGEGKRSKRRRDG